MNRPGSRPMSAIDLRGRAHDLLSQRVLLPLATARQLVRPATRPAMRALHDGLRFRQRAIAWTDDQRCTWMQGRLREV